MQTVWAIEWDCGKEVIIVIMGKNVVVKKLTAVAAIALVECWASWPWQQNREFRVHVWASRIAGSLTPVLC